MMAKGADQEKKSEDPKGEFPEAHKEVIYIYGGLESHQSRTKQKLTVREVVVASPTALEYLKWSEVSVTFDHSDHSDFVPKPVWYLFIVSPIIKDVKLN
jgi:hypothetical protein